MANVPFQAVVERIKRQQGTKKEEKKKKKKKN